MATTTVELPLETYKGPVDPDWCPGCGDFGVLRALELAAQSEFRHVILNDDLERASEELAALVRAERTPNPAR